MHIIYSASRAEKARQSNGIHRIISMKTRITESFGAGSVAVLMVAIASHYGKDLSLDVAIAIVGSLSPILFLAYGALKRYRQKVSDEKNSREVSWTIGELQAEVKTLKAINMHQKDVLSRKGITLVEGEGVDV